MGPRFKAAALFAEETSGGCGFENGRSLVIPLVSYAGEVLAYSGDSDAIVISKDGVFYVTWSVLVTPSAGDVVITLENLDDGTVYARSGNNGRTDTVFGAAALSLAAGTRLGLVNRSDKEIRMERVGGCGCGEGFAASITAIGL